MRALELARLDTGQARRHRSEMLFPLCRARPSRLAALLIGTSASLAACALPPSPEAAAIPEDAAQSLVRIGDSLSGNGDAGGAVGFYEDANARAQRDPRPLERLGEAQLALGDSGRAEQAFRAALSLDGASRTTRHGLGVALLLQGRPAEALPLLEEAAKGSSEPRLWRDFGVAFDLSGRTANAQEAYRYGLSLSPADADLHGNLALSLAVAGEAAEAAKEARAAVNSPRSGVRQRAAEVLVLALLGREEEARALGLAALGAGSTASLLTRAAHARTEREPARRAAALGLVPRPPDGTTQASQ